MRRPFMKQAEQWPLAQYAIINVERVIIPMPDFNNH